MYHNILLCILLTVLYLLEVNILINLKRLENYQAIYILLDNLNVGLWRQS